MPPPAASTGYEVVSATVTDSGDVQINAPTGKFVVQTYITGGIGLPRVGSNTELIVDEQGRATGANFSAGNYIASIICING